MVTAVGMSPGSAPEQLARLLIESRIESEGRPKRANWSDERMRPMKGTLHRNHPRRAHRRRSALLFNKNISR